MRSSNGINITYKKEEKEEIPISNSISVSKESAIQKVFEIEHLSYLISTFLFFDEKKTFYSINKKLNFFFRNSINQLKSKVFIKSPEIVERFQNLKIIEISSSRIIDGNLFKKKGLKNLQHLTLKGAHIFDWSDISELKELKSLILISNCIEDISFIKNLQISILDLGNNKIKDINCLKYLPNLKSLSLQQCELSNLEVLKHSNFKTLEKLFIGMNNIQNYSFLKNLRNLNTLNLFGSNLISIDFLKGLNEESIIELNLSSNIIDDYTPLLKFIHLKILKLHNNNLHDIYFLNSDSFSELEALDIGNNRNINDFSPLINLKNLRKICLFNCALNNIDFLIKKNFELLEYVDIGNNNKINDYYHINSLINLKCLKINQNGINDLDWLNNCGFGGIIEELNLANNNLYEASFDFFDGFKNLKKLNLSHCGLKNISFLDKENLSKIEELNIYGNSIKDLTPLLKLKKLQILNLKQYNSTPININVVNLIKKYIKKYVL